MYISIYLLLTVKMIRCIQIRKNDPNTKWHNVYMQGILHIMKLVAQHGIALLFIYTSCDYLNKISIKIHVATEEGNSRKEIWHWTWDEIGVAVQSWFWVRVFSTSFDLWSFSWKFFHNTWFTDLWKIIWRQIYVVLNFSLYTVSFLTAIAGWC